MRSINLSAAVALALHFAACVDASDHNTQINVVYPGASAPEAPVPAIPAPGSEPEPEPRVDEVEPRRFIAPMSETERGIRADDGLAPYPAWDGYDLDCSDMDRPVRVAGPDPHQLDRDGDGIGCESR